MSPANAAVAHRILARRASRSEQVEWYLDNVGYDPYQDHEAAGYSHEDAAMLVREVAMEHLRDHEDQS